MVPYMSSFENGGDDLMDEDTIAPSKSTPSQPNATPHSATTAASKQGATDGTAEDRHIASIAKYKSDISSFYPSNNPNDSVFDNLFQNWMEDCRAAIRSATATLIHNITTGEYAIERNDDNPAESPAKLHPNEIEKISHLQDCHSLFWSTESNEEETGICPFAEANRQWQENAGIATVFSTCNCSEGYGLSTAEMIIHLQSHNHWFSKAASLILMEHEVLLGVRSLKCPKSAIKETRSPHHPQTLFSSSIKQPPAKHSAPETIVIEDEEKQKTIPQPRASKLLAGILETSSDDSESDNSSDTASASKRYQASQRTRFKGDEPAKGTRTSTRIRKKKELLDSADDGESSIGSVFTNDHNSKSGD